MPKLLNTEQITAYRDTGLLFPIKVMNEIEARKLQNRLEQYEEKSGGPIQKEWRHKVHLLFTWANEIIRNPKILDAVEDLIGPNIMCHQVIFRF